MLTSAPVIFGTLGGMALIIGTGGLILFKVQSDSEPANAGAPEMDYVFLVTFGLTALTGMLTLILRASAAMGTILVLHLALISALFLTAPYRKFPHAEYRTLAVVRYEIEQSQPVAYRRTPEQIRRSSPYLQLRHSRLSRLASTQTESAANL